MYDFSRLVTCSVFPKRMHRSCLLLVGLLTLGLGCQAFAATEHSKAAKKKTAYGAIAWHRSSGSFGYSYDFNTARLDATEALNQCGNERCEIVIAIQNECGAIADGPKTFAARKGATRAEAQTKALNACGAACTPVAWACTR